MGQGSAGNVIAALCSFFIPGLGQLLQGRWFVALLFFVFTFLLWMVMLGWLVHLWAIIDAALFRRPQAWHEDRDYRSYRDYRRYRY